jgi:hypothetical protein
MKFVTGLLAAVLLVAAMGTSHAVVRIAEDRGGWARFRTTRSA